MILGVCFTDFEPITKHVRRQCRPGDSWWTRRESYIDAITCINFKSKTGFLETSLTFLTSPAQ